MGQESQLKSRFFDFLEKQGALPSMDAEEDVELPDDLEDLEPLDIEPEPIQVSRSDFVNALRRAG